LLLARRVIVVRLRHIDPGFKWRPVVDGAICRE
jgi:hypothetical protein